MRADYIADKRANHPFNKLVIYGIDKEGNPFDTYNSHLPHYSTYSLIKCENFPLLTESANVGSRLNLITFLMRLNNKKNLCLGVKRNKSLGKNKQKW